MFCLHLQLWERGQSLPTGNTRCQSLLSQGWYKGFCLEVSLTSLNEQLNGYQYGFQKRMLCGCHRLLLVRHRFVFC